MAAQEEQCQRVVAVRDFRQRGHFFPRHAQLLAAAPCFVGAPHIRQTAFGDRDQPPTRVFGRTVVSPPGAGGEQRLLNGVFRIREVAIAAQQQPQNLRCQLTQELVDSRAFSQLTGSGAS